MTFPGATADRSAADYAVVGVPLDATTSFEPGARFGPRRCRHYAAAFEDYDHHTDQHFTDLAVHDHGDVGPTDDVDSYLEFLAGTVGDYDAQDVRPLLLGGEHTVTIASVRALDPDVYVCLDAHLDLRESFRDNPVSHATVTNHVREVVDEVILLGARSGSAPEWERAEAADVTVVAPADVPAWEPTFGDARAYVSVDVDAADPGYAPGTGTREPFGLEPATMRDVVGAVAPQAVGFDVVEVTDRDHGQTATLAAKLLRRFVFDHAAGS